MRYTRSISLQQFILYVSLSLMIGLPRLIAQQKHYYFFRPLAYGSEALFNPVSLLANGGFDELQAYWRPTTLAGMPWKKGGKNVWANIIAPLPQINKYGWNAFISHEIIPTSVKMEDAQFFPNYSLHLLGGGMQYRKTLEWFDYYGYPAPALWAIIIAMGYHYVNEIIENADAYFYPNVDPIADLLIFDPLGIILFSFDGVCEFFSTKLNLNDWNSIPAFSFGPLSIRNSGQNFIMKYPITSSGKMSLMYHFGSFGEIGCSFNVNEEDAISVGVGVTSKQTYYVTNNSGTHRTAIKVGPMGGLYWDRNNSLMASLVVADNFQNFLRLNIYPGIVSLNNFSPGVFFLVGDGGKITVGATFSFLPLGISGYHP